MHSSLEEEHNNNNNGAAAAAAADGAGSSDTGGAASEPFYDDLEDPTGVRQTLIQVRCVFAVTFAATLFFFLLSGDFFVFFFGGDAGRVRGLCCFSQEGQYNTVQCRRCRYVEASSTLEHRKFARGGGGGLVSVGGNAVPTAPQDLHVGSGVSFFVFFVAEFSQNGRNIRQISNILYYCHICYLFMGTDKIPATGIAHSEVGNYSLGPELV